MAPLSALVSALTCFFVLGGANASLRGARSLYTIEVVDSSLPETTEQPLVETTMNVAETSVPETTEQPLQTTMNVAETSVPGTTEQPLETTQIVECPPTEPSDSIVIGAGMAGLTAAKTLKDQGFSYVVLEQSNRIGGRMMGADFAGEKVEKGANWIAGGGRTDLVNPILALADEFNISYYDQQYNLVGYEKGSTVPVDAKDVEKQVKEFLKARDCLDEISWADWATAKANEFISTPPGQNARQGLGSCGWELPADGSFRQALETTFIENDFLHSPEQTSTYNFGDSTFWDFGPENNFVRNGGIEEIAQQYAQTEGLVPNIQFGKDVVEIHYGGVAGELTSVTTADGCEYKATTIIFTPSLEVAKKMEEASVFSPALSPGVARSPLTADAWVRTYFHFNQTFWDTSGQWLAIGTERRGECSVWLNYDYQGSEGSLYPGSGIISCVMDQNTVDALLAREQKEVLDAEFAKEHLLNPLRATYPSTFVEPTDVLITDWKNDPTAYGSWENFPFGNDLSGYYDYFTPRNDKLFLSGSGSCLRYWGYMHGAYYAGIRDAEWAIATMNGGGQTVARPYSFCDDMNDF